MTREQVIEIAREWLGTPRLHQASVKGLGCDCLGFIKGVALEAGLISPELAASLPIDYSRTPSGGALRRFMGKHLLSIPISSLLPADIATVRFEIEEQHLVMLTDYGIIHCGRNGVVEHSLNDKMRSHLVRAYRFAGLSE